jgi:hypothetical protein
LGSPKIQILSSTQSVFPQTRICSLVPPDMGFYIDLFNDQTLGIRKFEIFFLSLFEFLSPELESSPEA